MKTHSHVGPYLDNFSLFLKTSRQTFSHRHPMDLITAIPTTANWCAPAIGIYTGCLPAYRITYTVHNWLVCAANLFSVVILLVFLLVRFNFSRLASANVYFVTSAMCMLGNICTLIGKALGSRRSLLPPEISIFVNLSNRIRVSQPANH